MKIFISGASGLVGGNCQQYFTEKNCTVMGTYFSFPTPNTVFFDTLHLDNANNADIKTFAPDIILHCGALTHVDYCETNPEESYSKTVESTLNLIKLATELNAKLVFLSTDYVFDGLAGPYTEDAKTNPLSVYAKHKLQAEEAVVHANKNNLVLRITNVYGNEIRNKNFVSRIIEQCQKGEELKLKLPTDQYATPVNAYDVARAMCLLLQDNKSGIYHIASTDFVNRVELALRVLQYFPTAKYNLETIDTQSLQQPAKRPLMAGLIAQKFKAEYPTFLFSNVDDYVKTKMA